MNSLARPCISTESTSCSWALSEKMGKRRWAETEWVKMRDQYRDKGRGGKTTFAATAYLAQGFDEAWQSEVLESKWKVPSGNERGQRIRSGNTIRSCLVHTPRCQELIMERTTWWSSTFIFLDREVCSRPLSLGMCCLHYAYTNIICLWS